MKNQIQNYNDKTNKELSLECIFYHDINGNLFLKIQNKYFVLFISSTDDIEWIELNDYDSLPQVNTNIKYLAIKNTYEKNSLKGKITKDLEEENNNDDDDVDEDLDGVTYYQNKYKSYPEDKLYVTQEETIDDNQEETIDDLECYYKFSKFGDESVITCLDRSLEVLANYDTFIMNNNTSYVLTTMQASEKSEYRVSLFTTGKMILNIVGSKLKCYDLYYTLSENNVIIICDNINTKIIIN